MLTPRELLATRFQHVFRGYHPGEVDEFIRRLISEYETLAQENKALKKQLVGNQDVELTEGTDTISNDIKADTEADIEAITPSDIEQAKAELAEAEKQVAAAGQTLMIAEQETLSFCRRMRSLLQEYESALQQGESEATRLGTLARSIQETSDPATD